MRKFRLFHLVLLSCLLLSPRSYGQYENLKQRARMMGVSERDIQSLLNGNNSLINSFGQQSSAASLFQQADIKTDPNSRERTALDDLIEYKTYLTDSLPSAKDLEKTVFGSEIFDFRMLSFEPNYNMPTPVGYVLAAGDEIHIDVWGDSENSRKATISPDGMINIPNVGLVSLSGLTIEEAEKKLRTKLSDIYSGLGDDSRPVEIKVTLGQIRSIKVNIVGEVKMPGTYTLPSLASVFNALYMAGGINDIGTLRTIKVYRNNKETAVLDVYDFLINGKTESNIRLQDNDLILVSPYENHVMINGKVKRNRIFEMRRGETLQDLLRYAGNFTGDAFSENIQVNRKIDGQYEIHTIEKGNFAGFRLQDGDSISIRPAAQIYRNRISIRGAVWYPGNYELSERTRTVGELVREARGIKGDAFTARGQIKRMRRDYTHELIPIDIRAILAGEKEDESLQPEDEVYIPSIYDLKEEPYILIRGEVNRMPIPDSVRISSTFDFNMIAKTHISRGISDTIPFYENMTIEDAILLAGGLKESASEAKVLVARRIKNSGATSFSPRIAEEIEFKINKDLTLDGSATNFVLHPFDEIYIRRSPGYQRQQTVTVEGEILFPGEYVLTKRNDRLTDLVNKTGGVTPYAYVKGAHLTRRKSESDLAKEASIRRISQATSMSRDTLSYDQLETERMMVGIDLEQAMANPDSEYNLIVQEGDILVIPQKSNTVKINGAVLYPNAATYNNKSKLKNYISQAGGYLQTARKKPYVVYMNGQVAATRGGLFGKSYPKIEPGCEIVVPMKSQNPRKMSAAEILSLGSSTASIAAMLTTILK